ncbi:hypothetical protein [Nocardiopsis sp. LOL_012]|uniref:hypothetical protein n=1 Tax=Nocardiopsis sp. LOL_012 TaxID=3345409 RepID=UPI003A8B1A4F
MPKMLMVDEEFDAIISGVEPAAKMRPMDDPDPREGVPAQSEPREGAPAKEEPAKSEPAKEEPEEGA